MQIYSWQKHNTFSFIIEYRSMNRILTVCGTYFVYDTILYSEELSIFEVIKLLFQDWIRNKNNLALGYTHTSSAWSCVASIPDFLGSKKNLSCARLLRKSSSLSYTDVQYRGSCIRRGEKIRCCIMHLYCWLYLWSRYVKELNVVLCKRMLFCASGRVLGKV